MRKQTTQNAKPKVSKTKNQVKLDNSPKVVILKSFKVSKESELLEFLYAHITNDSKNNIKHYLANRQVLVNGTAISQFNFKVYKEDTIQISKNPINKVQKETVKLDIIYEDEELIVINKPSGLLSIESDKEKTNTAYRMLTDYVQKKDKHSRIFIVHRIDKDTSGVLVVAKNEQIKNKLQHSWQDIVKQRKYIAICEGKFKTKEGTVRSYLKNNINNVMYSSEDRNGQLAITHYKVLKENNNYSLVEVNIDTGRKNQIRVHMKDLGNPIVGDEKYGTEANPIGRLGLHAACLSFVHPVTKKTMTFNAKVPQVFDKLFKK